MHANSWNPCPMLARDCSSSGFQLQTPPLAGWDLELACLTILNSSHALVNQPNAGPSFTTVTRNININVFTSVLVSQITSNCSYYNGEVGI